MGGLLLWGMLSFLTFYLLLYLVFSRRLQVVNRLDALRHKSTASIKKERAVDRATIMRHARQLTQQLMTHMPQRWLDAERRRLLQSGKAGQRRLQEWFFTRLLWAVGLPLAGSAVLGAAGLAQRNVLMLWVLFFAGVFLPHIHLSRVIKKRQSAILSQLPDALDLLTVSVQAGLGFDAAMAQVADKSEGALAEEWAKTLHEMKLGKQRQNALRDLGQRTDVEELITFTRAVIQADQLGVRIANVLQVQSQELRRRRRQRAQERAMKAPIKILFPLVFFVFPALFVIILGPAVIQMIQMFTRK